MKQITFLLFAAALWHVGTAWFAGSVLKLELLPFLIFVATAAGVAFWFQKRMVSEAEIETEVWSIFGFSITRDVILSLVALFVSSMGFYWVVLPRYGWDGYLAAVGVTYAIPYALSSGISVGL